MLIRVKKPPSCGGPVSGAESAFPVLRGRPLRVARIVFAVAGGYGLRALLPLVVLEPRIAIDDPSVMIHPEDVYGFLLRASTAWDVPGDEVVEVRPGLEEDVCCRRSDPECPAPRAAMASRRSERRSRETGLLEVNERDVERAPATAEAEAVRSLSPFLMLDRPESPLSCSA